VNLLDNQLSKPEILTSRLLQLAVAIAVSIGISIIGIHLVQVSDPYIQNVFSQKGDLVQGHAIFQMNCAGCHGWEGAGSVGPSLQGVSKRKSRFGLIDQVTSGKTPPMPQFQPDAQEMADLLSYLESL
jgi:cytochrome c553